MKSHEIPVTQAMLFAVRDELVARLNAMDSRIAGQDCKFTQIDAKFEQIDARFEQIDARFEQIDARFEQMEARFDQVDARFDSLESKLLAEIRRIAVIVEEQRAQNLYVLDGITNLSDRVARLEQAVALGHNRDV